MTPSRTRGRVAEDDAPERPGPRDGGFTLVELLVVVALIAIVGAGAGRGISTLLRIGPMATELVAQSRDQQQLTNYFYGDARSTPATAALGAGTAGYRLHPAADDWGCAGPEPGTNIVQLTWTAGPTIFQSNYLLVARDGAHALDRYTCAGDSPSGLADAPATVTRIAGDLDASSEARAVEVDWAPSAGTLTLTVKRGDALDDPEGDTDRDLVVSAALRTDVAVGP